jgi:hypothetical protein
MDSGGSILMNKEQFFPTPSFAARRESLSQLAAIAEKIAELNNNTNTTTTTTNTNNGNNNMTSTSTTTTSISEALRRNKRPSWMMMTEMMDNSTSSVALANNNYNPLAALLANGSFPSAGLQQQQQQHALANSLTGAVMEVMGPRQFKRTKFDHLTTNNLLHNPSSYDDDDDDDNDGGAASADDEQEQQDDVGSSGDDAGEEEEEEEEENDDQQEGEDDGEVGVRFREYQAGKCNDFFFDFFYSQSLGVSTIDDLPSRVNALTVVLPLHPSFILRNLVRKI